MAINNITLGEDQPLSNDLKPIKVGGEASILEISSPLPDGSDSGLFRVDGDLDITGTLKTKLSHDLIYDFDDEVNTLAQVKIDALIDSAPAALDTLNELAAALNDDASFSTTVTNSLALKAPLAAPAFTGNATFDSTTLTIDATNNRVGIGTASPNRALDVVGRLDVSGITNIGGTYLNVGGGYGSTGSTLDSSGNIQANGYLHVDGNVGIGTTSPEEALDITDTSNNHQLQLTGATNANSGIKFSDGTDADSASIYYYHVDKRLRFYTDNTEQMNILANGNVGIGTDSPDSPLHVKGAGDSNSTTAFEVDDSGGQNLFYVRDDGVVSITHGYLFAQHSNGAYFTGSIKARGGVTDDGGTLGLGGGGNLDHLNILSGGNVGIGTTSPSTELEVDGTGTFKNVDIFDVTEGNNPRLRVGRENAQHIEINVVDLDNTIKAEQDTDGNGDHNFILDREFGGTGANNFKIQKGGSDQLVIDTSGNLGIGISAPTTTLDVEGSVSYKHTAFSTAGPTDAVDVSDTTVLEVDTSSNNVVIGGFTGGVQGQILYIVKTDTANFIQLEHNEGGGSQDIFLTSGSDDRVVGYGGYTLYCNGTSWFALSNPTGAADAG